MCIRDRPITVPTRRRIILKKGFVTEGGLWDLEAIEKHYVYGDGLKQIRLTNRSYGLLLRSIDELPPSLEAFRGKNETIIFTDRRGRYMAIKFDRYGIIRGKASVVLNGVKQPLR